MTLLSPLFLLFGLTAAVPLILHLYRKRNRTVLEFSTNRFFTQAVVRAQRRLKLQRILLLALRMAACLLLALAVARPVANWMGWLGVAGQRDVVILLDDSASMQAVERGQSHFDLAKRSAVELVRQLAAGDRAAAVTFSGRTVGDSGGELTGDTAALSAGIEALNCSFAAGDPLSALARADDLLDSGPYRYHQVLVISDMQASDWPGAPWPRPRSPVSLTVLPAAAPAVQNMSVDSVHLLPQSALAGQLAVIEARLTNHGAQTAPGTLVVRIDDTERARRTVSLLSQSSEIQSIHLTFDKPGAHRLVVSLDPADASLDALPADNTMYCIVNVAAELPVLIVDGQPALTAGSSSERRSSAAFFLRAAMASIGDAAPVKVETVAPPELAARKLDNYRVVVLSNVRSLAAPELRSLESFVKSGGGLGIFLGDQTDVDAAGTMLAAFAPVKPSGFVGREEAGVATEPLHVQQVDENHPVFSRFSTSLRGALVGISVNRALRLEAGGAATLATLEGNAPLLVEGSLGKGRVLIWSTAPMPAWTNLPLRRAFVPLVNGMLSYLAHGEPSLKGKSIADPRTAPGFVGEQAMNTPRSESATEALSLRDLEKLSGDWRPQFLDRGTDPAAALGGTQPTRGVWSLVLWIVLAAALVEPLLANRWRAARP